MHDPRVGRFFTCDPLESKYPWYTPYQFSGNRVIGATELEGLEEKIVHTQYVGDKIYTTVLRRSNFTEIQWKTLQKTWWKSIILDAKRNEKNFGGMGFMEYAHMQFSDTKPAMNSTTGEWNGPEKGTLYICDYHGQMYYSYDKKKTDGGNAKIDIGALDKMNSLASTVESIIRGVDVMTSGSSMVVTVPITAVIEAVGTISSVEKFVIQLANKDVKDAIKTLSSEIVVPKVVGKIFDEYRKKTPKNQHAEINLIERLVNEAITKGLDIIEIPIRNNEPVMDTSTKKK